MAGSTDSLLVGFCPTGAQGWCWSSSHVERMRVCGTRPPAPPTFSRAEFVGFVLFSARVLAMRFSYEDGLPDASDL